MTYSESDLVIPSLVFISRHLETGVTTTDLIKYLETELDLSEEDRRILAGRNDSHFSQKVRNLVSHRTLVSKGLADYAKEGNNGVHKITQKGLDYINDHEQDYGYLVASGFDESERKATIDNDFKNLVIEEGFAVTVPQKEKRKRSRALTQHARKHYTQDGILRCQGCGFAFDEFYGPHAKNYIEIHHLKPIFTYDDGDISKSLEAALQDVRPLCANCHRMVHRDPSHLLSIQELNSLVKDHGDFEPIN